MDKLLEMMREKLGEELFTEDVQVEFQTNLDLLINEKANVLLADKEKALEEQYRKDADEFKSELIEQIDSYIDYAATKFLKENEIKIESEYKVKAADELIEAFCKILENNNFLVEPSHNQALADLHEKVKGLGKKVNESEKNNIKLKKELFEYKKALVFKDATKGLSEAKSEKVLDLMEGLEFADLNDFKKKLGIVLKRVQESKKPVTEKKVEDPDKKIIEEKKESSISKYL